MAEFDPVAAGHIGPTPVAPTDEQLANTARYDRSLAKSGLADHLRNPAAVSHVTLVPGLQVPLGGTVTTLAWKAPFPCILLEISAGAQVFGGSLTALAVDVLVEPAAGGGYATVLDAPEDVFPLGAGVTAEISPEDGSEVLAEGDKVRVSFTATADTADGAAAYLRIKRL